MTLTDTRSTTARPPVGAARRADEALRPLLAGLPRRPGGPLVVTDPGR